MADRVKIIEVNSRILRSFFLCFLQIENNFLFTKTENLKRFQLVVYNSRALSKEAALY